MARSRVRLTAVLTDSCIHALSSPVTGLTTTKTWLSASFGACLHIWPSAGQFDLQLSRRRLSLRRLGLILRWFVAAAPSTFAASVSLAILLLSLLPIQRLKLPVPR